MKNLFIYLAMVLLFTECKKTESAPDTCYLGVWGNNVINCQDGRESPKLKDMHECRLTLNADGTGKFERIRTCVDNFYFVLNFKYTVKDNTIFLTDKGIESFGNVYVGRTDNTPLGNFLFGLETLSYTCTDATHLQVKGGGTYAPYPISFLYVLLK
jgi:hypothetical protein